jgi:hypothetical protein
VTDEGLAAAVTARMRGRQTANCREVKEEGLGLCRAGSDSALALPCRQAKAEYCGMPAPAAGSQ